MTHARRTMHALVAIAVLGILVLGVPAALAALAGWPLPRAVPDWHVVARALQQGDLPATVVIRAVACVVWIAWLQLVWALAWELAVNVPRRTSARSAVPPPVVARPIADGVGRLVRAALMFGVLGVQAPVAAFVPVRATAAAPVVTAGPRATVRDDHRPAARIAARDATRSPTRARQAAPGAAAQVRGATPSWRVARGESLWSIAESALGDGARFGEIAALNPFVRAPRDLRPGHVLALPTDATVPDDRRPDAGGDDSPTDAHAVGDEPIGGGPGRAAHRSIVPPRLAERPRITIRHGDTLWSVAATHLGQLAEGRQIAAPAAVESVAEADVAGYVAEIVAANSVPSGDPDLIRPGEQFVLPETTSTAQAVAHPVAPDATGTIDSAQAAQPVRVAEPSAAADRPAAPASAGEIDAATNAPAATAPAPTNAPAASAPIPSNAPATSVPSSSPPARMQSDRVDTARPLAPIGLGGATLVATGAVGVIASRQRRRLRAMRPNDRLPVADSAIAAIERVLRRAADPQAVTRLDVALRALAAHAHANRSAHRPLLVARRATGEIDVWMSGPIAAPADWLDSGSGHLVLAAAMPLSTIAAAARGIPSPCPALVQLGRTIGNDDVYVDLEGLGCLVVDGPTDDARAVARAVVASLVVSPLAASLSIVASGVDGELPGPAGRLVSAGSPCDAASRADRAVAETRAALLASGAATTFALRAAAPEEPWEPVVAVVVGAELARSEVTALQDLVAGGGAALVVDRALTGGTWTLLATGNGRWTLNPIGIELTPIALATNELACLTSVLRAAERSIDRSLGSPDVDAEHVPAVGPSAAARQRAAQAPERHDIGPFAEPEWSFMVRLLGPIDVVDREGASVAFERAKPLELVAWLAEHRANPNRAGARAALWETDVQDATFLNVVSDARRTLARHREPPVGEGWIARTYGEQIPLHPLIVTDGALLEARLRHARRQHDRDAIATLRPGLALIRDLPFTGSSYLWPDGEAIPSSLVHLATSAAGEMAERCLATGDVDGALWATAQGLRALPGHEQLVCLRMRAHHAAGNHAGVRAEFESYERTVTNDPFGDGEPATHVVALRKQLMRRPPVDAVGAVGAVGAVSAVSAVDAVGAVGTVSGVGALGAVDANAER